MQWRLSKPKPLTFERLPFSHPLYILFSSGTTGVPKCIVHSAGGTLVQHLKEQRLHSGLVEGDRLFYFTTCGWMMWNWLVSGLASGATLLLYDGSPFHPNGNVLFDFADAEKMTFFGTSAKFIDSVRKADLHPIRTHDLSTVRTIASTGSPLSPEDFRFVYDGIKRDVHLASISGGTDIMGCFVLGVPTQPVWIGEIQGPGLGMAVDVWDDDGKPVVGVKGELVCTKAFPSMPVSFWNDPDGKKYHGAYFERFDNVWCHGDFAEWTEHGGMIIHGRSDATLNPGGVRIGTAEIYNQVEQMPEIIRGALHRPGFRRRCPRRPVRSPRRGRCARRRSRTAHQGQDQDRREPAPRAGEDRRRGRYPAHEVGKDHRACRARHRAWARGEEPRSARQSRRRWSSSATSKSSKRKALAAGIDG